MAGLGVKYLVNRDPATGHWDVTRGKPAGAFAFEMHTAIGSANREASLEAKGTDLKMTVWLEEVGKRPRKVRPA